ncbi:MAG: HAD-IA family hydrolase [Pseudomonadota bacterium]|nr:HAD-IA family hydrolase [Pseudomonadota bacterium]
MPIKHIVLDLGGVLIELEWRQNIAALFGEQLPVTEAQHRWSSSSLVLAHETGNLDLEQFVAAWCEELHLDSSEAVKEAFLSLLGALKPHTEPMLTAVGERFDLSMLSNVSHAHIQYLDERVDLKHQFSRRFLSCDLGKMKPVADVYQQVASELQSDAAEIAFFDDTRINVDAAIASGWQAWRVDSPQEIMKIIATQEVFQ